MNATNRTVSSSNQTLDLWSYHAAVIFSAFSFSVLAFSTVIGNGLFLFTFYKDPLKCLRTPSAIFIAGLTFANFLTGLIVEPILVWLYLGGSGNSTSFELFVEYFAFVCINMSFFIMLALGVVHYLAIAYPGVYENAVSPKKALWGMLAIWIYLIIFACLPAMGMDSIAFTMLDHILHTTLLTLVLMILYFAMYIKFRGIADQHRRMEAGHDASSQEVSGQIGESEQQRRQLEKDFALGTFSLTLLLLVTVWPFGIVLYIVLIKIMHTGFNSDQELIRLYVALMVTRVFLFLKFALDPFVFAWRLRKYRKSLVLCVEQVCPCFRTPMPTATYHRDGMDDRGDSGRGDIDDTIVEDDNRQLENPVI